MKIKARISEHLINDLTNNSKHNLGHLIHEVWKKTACSRIRMNKYSPFKLCMFRNPKDCTTHILTLQWQWGSNSIYCMLGIPKITLCIFQPFTDTGVQIPAITMDRGVLNLNYPKIHRHCHRRVNNNYNKQQ